MNFDLIEDNVRVSLFDDTNEGWNGDYNPDDPDDNILFRFDVCKLSEGEWENLESYCTQLYDLDSDTANIALKIIMDEIKDAVVGGWSIRKCCERLSWISNESLTI